MYILKDIKISCLRYLVFFFTATLTNISATNLYYSIQGGSSLNKGNSNNQNYNLGHNLKSQGEKISYTHNIFSDYGRNDEAVYRNYLNFSNTIDYTLNPKWEAFLFQYTERDTVSKLDYSNYSGLGLKYRFFNNKRIKFDFSSAPIIRIQQYQDTPVARQPGLSNRLRFFIFFDDTMTFKNTAFYVPVFSQSNANSFSGNYFSYISTLDIQLKEFEYGSLAIQFYYSLRHQEDPPAGATDTDQTFKVGLKFSNNK